MGSGSRLKFFPLSTAGNRSFGLGMYVSQFPFALTFDFHVLFWGVSIGLGRAYDAPRQY